MNGFLETAKDLASFVGVLVAIGLALGWLYSTLVRGSSGAAAEAAEAWRSELDAFKSTQARKDVEHREELARLQDELRKGGEERANLEGRVQQLSKENTDLRALIMGDKVPEALVEAISQISKSTVQAVEKIVGNGLEQYANLLQVLESEYLQPIAARVERRNGNGGSYEGPERRSDG